MALVASSISGAAYVMNNAEDKDTGNGFEFTRRKKWPQLLLQELVGSGLFCLKPIPGGRGSIGSADGTSTASQNMGWKMLYVSPSVGEMLGQKPSDLEGRDFLECVYTADHHQIHNMFNNLLTPHLKHHQSNSSSNSSSNQSANTPLIPHSTASKSQTTYVRMITESAASRPNSSKGSSSNSNNNNGTSLRKSGDEPNTVLWEIRAHTTGVEGADLPGGFGLGGAGTVVPQSQGEGEMRGKAIWLMGRRVGEGLNEGEGNGQNLDAFLELKLENEKLREELRELQVDFDEDDYNLTPSRPSYCMPQSPSSDDDPSSPSSSTASSPAYTAPTRPAKVGRPPKDKDGREKKKQKKSAAAAAIAGPRANGGGEGEGMHVCVTCGRTDSPEWRKGPLGPKTLCNACGLRWAKRNSAAPTRKEKKTTTGK